MLRVGVGFVRPSTRARSMAALRGRWRLARAPVATCVVCGSPPPAWWRSPSATRRRPDPCDARCRCGSAGSAGMSATRPTCATIARSRSPRSCPTGRASARPTIQAASSTWARWRSKSWDATISTCSSSAPAGASTTTTWRRCRRSAWRRSPTSCGFATTPSSSTSTNPRRVASTSSSRPRSSSISPTRGPSSLTCSTTSTRTACWSARPTCTTAATCRHSGTSSGQGTPRTSRPGRSSGSRPQTDTCSTCAYRGARPAIAGHASATFC